MSQTEPPDDTNGGVEPEQGVPDPTAVERDLGDHDTPSEAPGPTAAASDSVAGWGQVGGSPAVPGWPPAGDPTAVPGWVPAGDPTAVSGWVPAADPTAVSGWAPPSTTPPSRGSVLARRVAIVAVIGLIVVGVVASVMFRDRLSGSSTDLAIGDCFDAPSTANTTASSGVEIEDVQHHPCSEPHVYETFAVFRHPAPDGDPYPGVDVLFDYAETNCLPPFATYVGIDYQDSVLAVSYIVPKDVGWNGGQRTISCFAGNPDDSPITGSLKGAQR
jgi:hypothetical protein